MKMRTAKRATGSPNWGRILAIIVFSPLILTGLALLIFIAIVGYAITGKWELKGLLRLLRD